MEELVECMIKRKITAKAYIGRCLIMSLASLFLCITVVLMINLPYALTFALIFDVAVGFAVYFVFRNTNVEFEYGFFAGELTIDKIMGKTARKTMKVFNFNQLDFMAPESSEKFNSLAEATNITYYDYSTHDRDEDRTVAVMKDESGSISYLFFSPDEEMIKAFKKVYSRRIHEL